MKNKILIINVLIIIFISSISCNQTNIDNKNDKKAKYVFLFIGDGMGINQAMITNKYLQTVGKQQLSFTKFPNFALTYTNCLDTTKVTDSAAGGTAIATGHKTQFQVVGMDTITGENFSSFAEIAKKAGWKIGIISTVSLNHATPAAFYANQSKRSSYSEIANQIKETNFDFFAGGGIYINKDSLEYENIFSDLKSVGYQIIENKEVYDVSKQYSNKIFYSDTNILGDEKEMPYDIDKKSNTTNLLDFVDFGINFLGTENNFFIMTEGGKIDWACHVNDGTTAIKEVIDFDEAIQIALDFYEIHKDETLIIVTADHETGGMSFGTKKMKYNIDYSLIDNQKKSIDEFSKILKNDKTENYLNLIQQYFNKTVDKNYIKDLTPDEIAEKLVLDLNTSSGIGWTTTAHTGMPVGTYAIGVGSEKFNGIIDNTDIIKKILEITGL